MPKKPLPPFKTDEEEARWFAEHDGELDQFFGDPVKVEQPLAERLGLPPKKEASQAISLRLQPSDIERAKRLATKKGIGYQTLLKMIIHEALEREDASA